MGDSEYGTPMNQFERRAAEQLGRSRGEGSSSDQIGKRTRSPSPVPKREEPSPCDGCPPEPKQPKPETPKNELRLGPGGTFLIGDAKVATMHVPEKKMPAASPMGSGEAPKGSKKVRTAEAEAARAEARAKAEAEKAEAKAKRDAERAEAKAKAEAEKAKAKRDAEKAAAAAEKQAEKDAKKAKAAEEQNAKAQLVELQKKMKEQEAQLKKMQEQHARTQKTQAGKRTSDETENASENPPSRPTENQIRCNVCHCFVDKSEIEIDKGNYQCKSAEACMARATNLAPRKRKKTPLGGMAGN